MRYQRATDIVRLAFQLRGTLGGLTLDGISERCVSRRTAERMRDAVGKVFGPLEMVDSDDRKPLEAPISRLGPLVQISTEELAEIESAAKSLDRTGVVEKANLLRTRASSVPCRVFSTRRSSMPGLMQAEGLAMQTAP